MFWVGKEIWDIDTNVSESLESEEAWLETKRVRKPNQRNRVAAHAHIVKLE